MTTENEAIWFAVETTGLVFRKLAELHTVVHTAAELELEPNVEAVLGGESVTTLQAMLVAAIGLVSRGELLVMKEIVDDAVASGLYDELANDDDDNEKKG